METIDLRTEQFNTLNRPRMKYCLTAKFFFFAMDLVTGKKTTLAKAKLLEILASIPYREWEIRQYIKMTKQYRNTEKVEKAEKIMLWGREAQDNEYMHLLVIHEKMKEDEIKDPWYLFPPIALVFVFSYVLIAKLAAFFSIKSAFYFNAEFEDHAEHVYAQAVKDNPQWENEKVTQPLVKKYADVDNWADVFRRISLDERDHMNHSFFHCNQPEKIVQYKGMQEISQK